MGAREAGALIDTSLIDISKHRKSFETRKGREFVMIAVLC